MASYRGFYSAPFTRYVRPSRSSRTKTFRSFRPALNDDWGIIPEKISLLKTFKVLVVVTIRPLKEIAKSRPEFLLSREYTFPHTNAGSSE